MHAPAAPFISNAPPRLRAWLAAERPDIPGLSANPSPGAAALLLERPGEIRFDALARTPNFFAVRDALLREADPVPYTGNEQLRLQNDQTRALEHVQCRYLHFGVIAGLCANADPRAALVFKEIKHLIRFADWSELSANPGDAVAEMLRRNPHMVVWSALVGNPNPAVVAMFGARPRKMRWGAMSSNTNPDALAILRANPARIDWLALSANPAPEALDMLRARPRKIRWFALSRNPAPGAMAMLRANPSRIHWANLSRNPAPEAIALLRANLDRADWARLQTNPGAIELLAANSDRVVWVTPPRRDAEGHIVDMSSVWANPAIFEDPYDYAAMRARMDVHREALAAAAFHPRRLARWLEAGGAGEWMA